jgi:phosphatidate cytidylyltransferase
MKNFWIRLGSSISIVIIGGVTVFSGGYFLAAALLLISFIAYRELFRACKLTGEVNKISILEIAGYLAILIYYLILVFNKDITLLFLFLNAALVIFMVLYVVTFPKYHARQIMEAYFLFYMRRSCCRAFT